jgi:hypothetical protein
LKFLLIASDQRLNSRLATSGKDSKLVLRVEKNLKRFLPYAAAFAALAFVPAASSAQTRLEAHYRATLGGVPIGSGHWIIDIGEQNFSAEADGKTTGLLRAITGGGGTSNGRGAFNGSNSVYSSVIVSGKKRAQVYLTLNHGKVKETSLDPPLDKNPERKPITEAQLHGVVDPMSASIVQMPSTAEAVTPEACRRKLTIFDGRLRYDLQLAFKRMEHVKAQKGYDGAAVVCSVRFIPVAGHVPSRYAIKYIANSRDIEIWLAPVTGTRVLVPFRVQAPTPIGSAVLQATEFVSAASTKHPAEKPTPQLGNSTR